jgi:hypothetical protein
MPASPVPTPCAETPGAANHPTPQTIAPLISLRAIGPIGASLAGFKTTSWIILHDFDGIAAPEH